MPCINCGREPVINKKYGLCPNCNSIRLHGKSLGERQKESVERYRNKLKGKPVYPSLRQRKPIRKQTSKDAKVKAALSELKFKLELDALQDDRYYCCGCGCTGSGLDKSHILSIGQFKKYELLESNIQLMCRNCHMVWETGNINKIVLLDCFVENMVFIHSIDIQHFNKLFYQIPIENIEEYLTKRHEVENILGLVVNI